jgi:ACT domain-containing protein
MNAITKASRVNSALQVIQHMNQGMSVTAACREVGIPRSTYYYIIQKNPMMMAEVQDIIYDSNIQQLGLILQNRTGILRKVIADGLSDETKPRERLAIYKQLIQVGDELSQALQVEDSASREEIESWLTGPILEPGVSRFSAFPSNAPIDIEG